jgi:hypothetical protein
MFKGQTTGGDNGAECCAGLEQLSVATPASAQPNSLNFALIDCLDVPGYPRPGENSDLSELDRLWRWWRQGLDCSPSATMRQIG